MSWEAWSKLARDETYWQNHQERGLLKAEPLEGYILRLWFEESLNVAIYELDFAPLLFEEEPGPVFLPLREIECFQFVKGDHALIWPSPETGAYDQKSIDLAPECIRFFCERYGKLLEAPLERTAA
ncbi:MAG: hypothetical protein AAFV72_10140 [Cyanobacteria bacterium J06635_1]